MSKEYKNKVSIVLFGVYWLYMIFYMITVVTFEYPRSWIVSPCISMIIALAAFSRRKRNYTLQAYTISVLSMVNIWTYSMMTGKFAALFPYICAFVSMYSFYQIIHINYLMLGIITVYLIYGYNFLGNWGDFLIEQNISIHVGIVSIYTIQFIMILYVRQRQKMQEQLEGKVKELEVALQAKADFLANMSHEIRTPMNVISGMVELALRSNEIPEKEREYLHDIQSAGRELLAIINDLLDFAKIDTGEMQISEEVYEITSVVYDVTNVVQVMLGEKDVTLSVEMNSRIPAQLKGDGVRLKQIILNLLGNAAKYTEHGSIQLKVDFETENGKAPDTGEKVKLLVSVEDTGIGISEDRLEGLFTAFTQVDSRRNRAVGGTGLGLAITKQLMDLMHGTMSVSSKVGEGSTFSFTLEQTVIDPQPCIGAERQTVEVDVLRRDNIQSIQNKKKQDMTSFRAPDAKILIVDDNRVNQKVAEGLLRPYLMHIDLASSGEQAIQMVQSGKYDLVLMDHMMPKMDGLDATKIIREMGYNELPIVALSANAIHGVSEMFIAGGMNDFVAKPIEMRIMDAKLKKWLPLDKVISKTRSGIDNVAG